ncbi:unnamed protein product [Moneuplotes crassus]|uniref:Uncharacterized protein n=1 Tax=Euplotes crassus TaxID=5936 RepID=A0AAD1XDW1_EUPCR|nr:unnamed protein product [Moneuplotes crassus]
MISLMKELHFSEDFKHFCIRNYLESVCYHLKINKSNIARFVHKDIEQECFKAGLERTQRRLEDTKMRLQNFQKKTVNMITLSNQDKLKQCYEMITERKGRDTKDFKIRLDLSDSRDYDFMAAVQDQILPDFSHLRIDNVGKDFYFFKDFIFFNFPQNIGCLYLNLGSKMCDAEAISDIIIHVSPRISRAFYIGSCDIKLPQMKNILQICKRNQRIIGLLKCKLELDTVPDLEYCLSNSEIREIHLDFCGGQDYCDWENHPERFSNLIEAFSMCTDFKCNLKKMCLGGCGMTEEHYKKILTNFGFNIIKISDHFVSFST